MLDHRTLMKVIPALVYTGAITLLLLAALFFTGCAKPTEPGEKRLPKMFGQAYQGVRAAEPDLLDGGERLDLFLGVVAEPDPEAPGEVPQFVDVIYCVATNREEDPLPEVSGLVSKTPPDRMIYIWGAAVRNKHGFWWAGVDCEAKAIAVWHHKAAKYVYYDLVYGRPFLQWRHIRALLKEAVKKGGKAAVKGVIP